MATHLNIFQDDGDFPNAYKAFAIITILILVSYFAAPSRKPVPGFPLVRWQAEGLARLLPDNVHWFSKAREIIAKGQNECKGSCFQVKTANGYKVVVPNRFAEELKAHKDLNFPEAFKPDSYVNYPGFEGNRAGLMDGTFIQDVVRIKLTQSLGIVTDALVSETEMCLADNFGECSEWTTFQIKRPLLETIARLSSRVFLGEELSHNREWIKISQEYTVDSFLGAAQLGLCPPLLRPILYWFIPTTARLRKHVRLARQLIMGEVEQRRMRAEKALEAGEKIPKRADAIGWMVEVSKGRKIDYVAAQLSLTQAAIHTTSETSAQCIRQLCLHPEAVEGLRQEVSSILQDQGWTRVALSKMTLMDSFLKEVQRVDGLSFMSMQRMVMSPITLSDGTILPAGIRIMVPDDGAHNATIFPDPDRFDTSRFKQMRQRPGDENRHQFVTPTPEGMGFGYGEHACPGRFFASNELKILLAILVLRYDVRLLPDDQQDHFHFRDIGKMVEPKFTVQLRKRNI